MDFLPRTIQKRIETWLGKGKIIILYGARQVGKTTLVKEILKEFNNDGVYLNCDRHEIRTLLQDASVARLKSVIGKKRLAVIDEAQRIDGIGLTLKLIHDEWPELQLIATGSSSFDLANRLREPMTGRTVTFQMHPLSLEELQQRHPLTELDEMLPFFMRFGSYPDISNRTEEEARELLINLSDAYLYRDVLNYEQLRKPDLVVRLLQLLAMQVGNEVSRHELATTLQVSRDTINRYVDLLEKSFVIFRLRAYSRNLRKEISKKEKIYFYDTGIRNSLISRFNPLDFRDDIGALWENFMITERLKWLDNHGLHRNKFFWRTHSQKEIDYIEEYDEKLDAFEIKWGKADSKPPKLFMATYPHSSYQVVSRKSFRDFVLQGL